MWSSGLDDRSNKKKDSNNNSNSGHGGSSRIGSSSSSSRSSPSSNSSILPQTPRRRNMEEVWKDISLTTLHNERPLAPLLEPHSHAHHHHHHHHHRAMILQDFLSGPFSTVSPADAAVENIPLPPPPPLLPPTALSLSSGLELQYLGGGGCGGGGGGCGCAMMTGHSSPSPNSNCSRVNCQVNSSNNNGHGGPFMSPSFSDAVIGPPSPAGLFSFCSKKRMMPEVPGIGGDRRHKRMIKNRESAARSRARKQAHPLSPL